jgi:hypothetical protein
VDFGDLNILMLKTEPKLKKQNRNKLIKILKNFFIITPK